MAELQRLDEQRARHEARSVEQAQEIAEVLGKTVLRFDVKSGPTGALFGSVTTTDIADELWRSRKIRIDRKKIGTDSFKRIGRYSIPIQVFEDVSVEVKTLVVPEGGELPPEEELAAMEAAEQAEADAQAAEAEADRASSEAVEYLDEPEAEAAAESAVEAEVEEEAGVEPQSEAAPVGAEADGGRDRSSRPLAPPQACGGATRTSRTFRARRRPAAAGNTVRAVDYTANTCSFVLQIARLRSGADVGIHIVATVLDRGHEYGHVPARHPAHRHRRACAAAEPRGGGVGARARC